MTTLHQLLHPSGEFAARMMIIAMMITPLVMLFKGWRDPRWLMKRRRYLGVAASGYAPLHPLLHLVDLDRVVRRCSVLCAQRRS